MPSHIEVHAFRGEKDVLSNRYRVKNKIVYDDVEYDTVEHGYKTLKAVYHGRKDLAHKISDIQNSDPVQEHPISDLFVSHLIYKIVEKYPENLENYKSIQ